MHISDHSINQFPFNQLQHFPKKQIHSVKLAPWYTKTSIVEHPDGSLGTFQQTFGRVVGEHRRPHLPDHRDFRAEMTADTATRDNFKITPGFINLDRSSQGIYQWNKGDRSYFVIDQGQSNTDGYRLELAGIENNRIKIRVVESKAGELAGMEQTHPALALSLPKGDYQIELVDRDNNKLQKEAFPISSFKQVPTSLNGKKIPLLTIDPKIKSKPSSHHDYFEQVKGEIKIPRTGKGIYQWDENGRSNIAIDLGACLSTGYGLEFLGVEGNHVKVKVNTPDQFLGLTVKNHPALCLSLPKGNYQIDLVDKNGNPLTQDYFTVFDSKPAPNSPSKDQSFNKMPLITIDRIKPRFHPVKTARIHPPRPEMRKSWPGHHERFQQPIGERLHHGYVFRRTSVTMVQINISGTEKKSTV